MFRDPWASALAGERGRELLRRKEERDRREDVLLPLRTRWFDDAVATELSGQTGQLVELGSGLDTRPYRLQLPAGTRAFELDQSSVLRHKEAVMATTPAPHRSAGGVRHPRLLVEGAGSGGATMGLIAAKLWPSMTINACR
ncbi:class I SAM-dependent methyltransferase [Planotetraspora thailandica]|uniref:class I SAM-dependent methyltransferase n=1 Tax=Planotetraspora thailandica TaxID=487172 RepID=UPI0023B29087|nr:class I SAM-dependent methyltransferase [Planotetraspora thailandica]